jgi:hypothetical protein
MLEVIRFNETQEYIKGIYEIFSIYKKIYDRSPWLIFKQDSKKIWLRNAWAEQISGIKLGGSGDAKKAGVI